MCQHASVHEISYHSTFSEPNFLCEKSAGDSPQTDRHPSSKRDPSLLSSPLSVMHTPTRVLRGQHPRDGLQRLR